MEIEVVYALPDKQSLVTLELAGGATVADALAAVRDRELFADLDLQQVPVGIFGEVVERTHLLEPFDRVEIYRALEQDPKSARRARAELQAKR